MPYPYGPAYRLLLLTGLRLNEVADAAWGEFHPAVLKALRQREAGANVNWKAINRRHLQWVIPAARMKGKNSRARPHAIPLIPEVLAILETLPMFSGGDFVFSTTAGKKPAWMGNKIKRKLDGEMLALLRANAGLIGEDPRKVRLESWTNHDLRRVVRSGLSRLRIPDNVSEAILAHAPAIISKTYNVDDLFEQKAEALTAWASRLRDISEPPPVNVAPLHARA
jgi:integrase